MRHGVTVKSLKNYLLVFLVLTTLGGGALAWQQYQELVKLRAAALSNDERADWQKRLWAAQKRQHELEDALAALRGRNGGPDGGPDGPGGEGQGRRGGRGNMAANFMALMEKPEMQKLMAIQQRAALDSRYAALFKSLNLSPEQLSKFKDLLVEKGSAIADVMAAARSQGVSPQTDPAQFKALIADAQAQADANIQATLGDAAFAQYQQYQQTLPQRNVVNQLAQSLSYTNTPLTDAQTEAMVQLLASTSPPSSDAAITRAEIAASIGNGFGGGGGGGGSQISDAAIAQASSVLAATQLQALQQLQQSQQAQAQINAALRAQFGGGTRTATPVATPTTPHG
jgi:hypothetical protein